MFLGLGTPVHAACVQLPHDGPGVSGLVDGRSVTVIINAGGGNGGASDVTAFWYTVGPNGYQLAQLRIKTPGSNGDRMQATFARGKLYITNAIYLSGEAHCCYTHLAVQRFGVIVTAAHDASLTLEGFATTAMPPRPKIPDERLFRCPADTINQQWRDYLDGPYKRSIINAVR